MHWIRCSRRRCLAIAERRRVGWRGQIVQPHERQLRHQTCRETRSLVPSVCCADTQLRTRKMTNDSRVFGSTQAMFPRNSVFAWLGPVFFFRIHRSLGIGFCMLLLLSVCRLMISDCKCTTVFGTDIWCGQTSDHVLEVAMVFDSWITAIHSCWLLDTLVCRTGLPKPNHPIPLWGYPSFLIKCRFVSPANKTSLIARKAGKEGPKILVQNPHVACRIDWTGLKILNHHGMSHFVYFVNVLQLHFSFCYHKCETSFPVLLCTSPSSASKISINAWTGTTLAGGRFGWSISTQAADVLLCTCESLNLKRRSSTHRNSQNVV